MIKFSRLLLCITFLLLCAASAHAQGISRYNTFSYNVNDGLLQSTIADLCFDKNNFCWISFPNGIQKFDGKTFVNVPVQQGLPDDKMCYFFACSNGNLLISHSQGISRYDINSNRFTLIYKKPAGEISPSQFIGEDDGTIYFYSQNARITGIACNGFKVVSDAQTGFPDYTNNNDGRPKLGDNIINHKAALQIGSSLYLWDLKNKRLVSKSPPIPDLAYYLLRLKNENEVFFYTYKVRNGIQLYNFANGTTSLLLIKAKDNRETSRAIIYPWQTKTLLAFNNRLYECDSTLQVLNAELVNFQNQPAAGPSGIAKLKEDNFGNLYVQTVTNGIKKIIRNNYPIKYYSSGKAEENFILSIYPDKKNNRILAGTAANGLLIFDTLHNLVKHIQMLPGSDRPMFPGAIIKHPNGNYLLFVAGEKYICELSKDLSQLRRIPISTTLPSERAGVNYFANFLFQNSKQAIVQSQEKVYNVNFATNQVQEYLISTAYIMSGLSYNNMIITHGNDQLIYLDATTFKEIKRVQFRNTGYVRCFAQDEAANVYVGSNKGIFKIDSNGKVLKHWDKESGLPDECVYAMVFDDEGLLWCSTNKGVFRLNKDNSILQLKKEDGLQENEFNTNSVAKAEDGEIFFGGVNGISSFYPSAIKLFEEKINLLITKIKINNREAFNDTAFWNIDKLDLEHNQNSLSFDFIAMANNNPGQYIYQYKMKGIDEQWIQNDDLQTVRYFLQPGKYVFQVSASRFFDKDAKPMKEIYITINQPFWKTWWFTALWIAALASLFVLSINRYNKLKYKRKLSIIESDIKIQKERERISRDLHDNIGAYANAVLYNTELLQKENEADDRNELMNDLKFASKDIIVALRETVWALKKDHYSAQDCLLRIRNFVHPFTRYYQNIKFKVEGSAPLNLNLHSTTALNLVRIVQEAVSNAIKHAGAKNISITSSIENERWKLAVEDDGSGFDVEGKEKLQSGNGLNNMNQRATDSGFELSITSSANHGTVVNILIDQ